MLSFTEKEKGKHPQQLPLQVLTFYWRVDALLLHKTLSSEQLPVGSAEGKRVLTRHDTGRQRKGAAIGRVVATCDTATEQVGNFVVEDSVCWAFRPKNVQLIAIGGVREEQYLAGSSS